MENTKTEGADFTKFTFSLSSSDKVEGNNLDLSSMKLDFEMIHDHHTGYWNVSAMTVAVVGKMKGNCSDVGCDVDLKDTMRVAPRRGYTDSPVDVNCQRNYTTCTLFFTPFSFISPHFIAPLEMFYRSIACFESGPVVIYQIEKK